MIREMASGRFTPMLVTIEKPASPFLPSMHVGGQSTETGGSWRPRLGPSSRVLTQQWRPCRHFPCSIPTFRSLLMMFQSLQITLRNRNRGLGAMSFDQIWLSMRKTRRHHDAAARGVARYDCPNSRAGHPGHEIGVDQQHGGSSLS